MNQDSKCFKSQPRWFWMFLAWASMCILMCLGPLNYLVLIVMAGLLAFAVLSRSWRPMVVLMLSPIVVSFAAGALSWFSLRPAFITYGLPASGFYNLSPETRTYWDTMGCVMDGGEELELGPRNLGLELMLDVFGNPPRTYAGKYPSQDEAEKLTRSVPVTPMEAFKKGLLHVAGRSLSIDERQSSAMLDTCRISKAGNSSFHKISVRSVQAGEDALLIRLTVDAEDHAKFLENDHVFLLDRKRLWPFAIYALKKRLGGTRHPYFAFRDDASELIDLSNLPPQFSGPLY